MAISYSYNGYQTNLYEIYRTTSGGTNWSANLATQTTFDYFDDSAVVDDALYFTSAANYAQFSDLKFNVGTAMVGTGITLVWEYVKRDTDYSGIWAEFEDLVDDTNSFTTTGVNTVKFPLQWRPATMTLNSLNRTWFRCRISALTTITEGGANQTDTVKRSDGKLTISGGETTPVATFTTIYDWLVANKPYISISRSDTGTFNFTKVAIHLNGRTESFSEVVEIGQDCVTNTSVGANNFTYLTSGVRSGNRGYNGSTFILHGTGNSQICTLGEYSKIYGCTFKRGKTQEIVETAFPGYFNFDGEVYDSTFEVSPYFTSAFASTDKMVNVKIFGSIAITSNPQVEFNNVTYVGGAGQMFYTVPSSPGFTFTNLDYTFAAGTGTLFYFYSYCFRYTDIPIDIVNPVTPLGSYGDGVKPYDRSVGGPYNIPYVKWYDDSTGTYTDYTTEAADATPNNVPLGGDVGDMLYLSMASYYAYGNFYLERTGATNDYEYIWEYYYGGNWIEVSPYLKDGTNNLSDTGYFLSCVSNPQRATTITIDGVTTYWMRLRIVTKGTGSPTCDRLRAMRVYGQGDWTLNQKYSVDLKIVDTNGDAIEGATVTCTYADTTQAFSVETSSDGTITQQLVVNKSFAPNPGAEYLATKFVKETEYTTFNFLITATGYETYTQVDIPFTGKVDSEIALKEQNKTRKDIEGNLYLAIHPETGSSAKIIKL